MSSNDEIQPLYATQLPEEIVQFLSKLSSPRLAGLLRAITVLAQFDIVPRLWQLETANSVLDRRNTVVIASTSAGKTLVMVIVMLADPKAIALALVPLKALMQKQVIICLLVWVLPLT